MPELLERTAGRVGGATTNGLSAPNGAATEAAEGRLGGSERPAIGDRGAAAIDESLAREGTRVSRQPLRTGE